MNETNNMGGIVSAEYMFADELLVCGMDAHSAVIRIKPGCRWRILPTIWPTAAPTVAAESADAGTIYTHTVTIRISRHAASEAEVKVLRTLSVRECVLKCQDTNGNIRLYGGASYPLFGNLNELNGKTAADFSGYELTLTGKSLYPQLPLTEL